LDAAEADLCRRQWDVIVVGTGVGGSTVGHALAAAGHLVLFCELGHAVDGLPALRGGYPELSPGLGGRVLGADDSRRLLAAGRSADVIDDCSARRRRRFVPFIGCGAGGSSALYGMAFERLMPADFNEADPASGEDGRLGGQAWPVSYAEMASYYHRAERLYRVRGERDPVAQMSMGPLEWPALGTAPALSPAAAELASYLRNRGLHPYALPSACEQVPGCETCQGYLCDRGCKNDAFNVCLAPAVRQHGASVIDRCRVTAIRHDGRRVTGVHGLRDGRPLRLQARHVVLAAGALQTPCILLASDSSASAKGHVGLGNQSGLLGRGLMRHLIDLYLVRPRLEPGEPLDNRRKELAFNDFYRHQGTRLGTVQSFGRLPPADMLLGSLQDDWRASPWGWSAGLVGPLKPLLKPLLHDMAKNWLVLASIAEDLPRADNAVTPGSTPGSVSLRYRLDDSARARVTKFRGLMAQTLAGRRWRRVAQAENNQRIAHVCGTCRFGDDPVSSVLDRWNRVRGIDNLSVVDSSFFPTSGGTNPSLTIAANALRVADQLGTELG
jgi:choline dehydrogenase-like flavoprotein